MRLRTNKILLNTDKIELVLLRPKKQKKNKKNKKNKKTPQKQNEFQNIWTKNKNAKQNKILRSFST